MPASIPRATPLIKKGRKKQSSVEIKTRNVVSINNASKAFKINDDFSTFILNDDFDVKFKPGTKTKLLGSKSNKIEGVNYKKENVFKSYKSDVRNLPASIFSTAMDIIIRGVIKNEFTFTLPRGVGIIKVQEITKKSVASAYFKKYKNLQPEDTLFKVYCPVLNFYMSRRNQDFIGLSTRFIISKHYREIFEEECKKLHNFNTINKLTTRQLVDKLLLTYYDVPRTFIRRCLAHGFKYMRVYTRYGIALKINKYIPKKGYSEFSTIRTSMGKSRERYDAYTKAKRIIRQIYRYTRRPYNGFYYTCLSEYEMLNIKQFEIINKKLYLCKEEAMLDPLNHPHIIAIRIPRPIKGKLKFSLNKSINYAQNDIEYVWRWDGSRFRTTNYSEYSFNRLS